MLKKTVEAELLK